VCTESSISTRPFLRAMRAVLLGASR
jgi:hypothetical protein